MGQSSPLKLVLWFAAGIMLEGTVVTLVILPFRICPDCEGTGEALIVLGDAQPTKCIRCQGQQRISALRKWSTKPEPTYVGGIQVKDWPYVDQLSKRE